MPADLAVADADLEIVIERGRHPDGAEGGHGRLEQHAQCLPPDRRHSLDRHADLEEHLVGVQVDGATPDHAPEDGQAVRPAVLLVHLVERPVVAEADVGSGGAGERQRRRGTGRHPEADRMPKGLGAQRRAEPEVDHSQGPPLWRQGPGHWSQGPGLRR